MDRRIFLKNAVCCGTLAAAGYLSGGDSCFADSVVRSAPLLKQVGAPAGLRIGSAISRAQLQEFPGFARFFADNFNLLTPNSEMKWAALHPEADRYDFHDADLLVSFAEMNGIAVHGHNLCWNAGNPSWLGSRLIAANAEAILRDHITTVMTHFRGKMDSWDVVNEPIGIWFHRPDGLYDGPWLDALGPQYIDLAFSIAAEVDPKPLRILNVHNVEHGGADHDAGRRATLDLATRLVKNRVPIQAVGVESHLDGWRYIDTAALTNFIKQLRDLGLQVFVTELDVNDSKIDGSIEKRDQVVADCYRKYVSAFYSSAGTPNRLILWSPTDRQNWMNYLDNQPRWQRSDGDRTHRPGILDTEMKPKPAFFALASAIQGLRRS